MPLLRIETNQTSCHVPKDFHKTTTELIARMLEKPAERCCVTVVTDLNMSRGGCTDPCGFAQLMSIGHIDEERNKSYVAVLSAHLEKFLGISRKRLLIRFVDEKPENLGNSGTTYKELLQEYKPKKKKKGSGSSDSGSSDSDSDGKKKGKGKKGKKGKKGSVSSEGSKGKRKGSVDSEKDKPKESEDKEEPAEEDIPEGEGEVEEGGGEGAEGGEGGEGEGGEGEE